MQSDRESNEGDLQYLFQHIGNKGIQAGANVVGNNMFLFTWNAASAELSNVGFGKVSCLLIRTSAKQAPSLERLPQHPWWQYCTSVVEVSLTQNLLLRR